MLTQLMMPHLHLEPTGIKRDRQITLILLLIHITNTRLLIINPPPLILNPNILKRKYLFQVLYFLLEQMTLIVVEGVFCLGRVGFGRELG